MRLGLVDGHEAREFLEPVLDDGDPGLLGRHADSVQAKTHVNSEDELHGLVIDVERRVPPLHDGLDCRLVQWRDRPEHPCLSDVASFVYRGFHNDRPLDAGRHGGRGVDGLCPVNELGGDGPSDAYGLRTR